MLPLTLPVWYRCFEFWGRSQIVVLHCRLKRLIDLIYPESSVSENISPGDISERWDARSVRRRTRVQSTLKRA